MPYFENRNRLSVLIGGIGGRWLYREHKVAFGDRRSASLVAFVLAWQAYNNVRGIAGRRVSQLQTDNGRGVSERKEAVLRNRGKEFYSFPFSGNRGGSSTLPFPFLVLGAISSSLVSDGHKDKKIVDKSGMKQYL